MIPRFRAYLFDIDGTLLDSAADICGSVQQVLSATDCQPVTFDYLKSYIGLHLLDLFQDIFPNYTPGQHDELIRQYRAIYPARGHKQTQVFPGVREGLAELKSSDLRLAVVTGKAQDGADSTVAAAGLKDVIDVVLGYTSVANPKPAPDIALLALEKLGAGAPEAVIVGDSTHDLEMARRAGVRPIAVTYGALPETVLRAAAPTWVAHSFPEVVRIARGLANLGTP